MLRLEPLRKMNGHLVLGDHLFVGGGTDVADVGIGDGDGATGI